MSVKDQQNYNALGFISPKLVEILDSLEETTVCKRQYKYHLKRTNVEAQKVITEHYKLFNEYGELTTPNGLKIDAEDIYNNTAKSYDFLLSKNPNELCVIADIMQKKEAEGFDYKNYLLECDMVLK